MKKLIFLLLLPLLLVSACTVYDLRTTQLSRNWYLVEVSTKNVAIEGARILLKEQAELTCENFIVKNESRIALSQKGGDVFRWLIECPD